jgi:uncharacterized membrane protein YgcG
VKQNQNDESLTSEQIMPMCAANAPHAFFAERGSKEWLLSPPEVLSSSSCSRLWRCANNFIFRRCICGLCAARFSHDQHATGGGGGGGGGGSGGGGGGGGSEEPNAEQSAAPLRQLQFS